MPRITYITFAGERHTVEVPAGTTLMEAATNNSVPGIDGDCGGQCACATCHIYIEEPWSTLTGERSESEEDMLNFADDFRPSSRLGCQIRVTDAMDGLEVAMPEGQH
ncbi:MAG: 2Fe-2S iron-sulfur cluster-binding protein [Burkholderiaceae bacterium]|jgi:2Fe-2S ferredoxin|nr:2Fe-2S iron-sulfur cluster binding domain-containing protein [Gemmatimonadales bacterium]MCO5118261.1 2Fe-2S iron-sulfur cluster-binding protein [Burkholderiaceae bacterium]MEB2318697.1 2Fe-2S iron-sulfur cluster-binding protein [Pseudomonadota bacterium]